MTNVIMQHLTLKKLSERTAHGYILLVEDLILLKT